MTEPEVTDAAAADGGMIRSEERLRVALERVPVRKAVLRKVIVVEQRTIILDVAHEEIRLDYLPFEDSRGADDGPCAPAVLPELVLYEEQVVISTRTVPTERVQARVVSVVDEQQITADLRREQIEVVAPLQS